MTEATTNNALAQQTADRAAELAQWAKVLARPANYKPRATVRKVSLAKRIVRALFN